MCNLGISEYHVYFSDFSVVETYIHMSLNIQENDSSSPPLSFPMEDDYWGLTHVAIYARARGQKLDSDLSDYRISFVQFIRGGANMQTVANPQCSQKQRQMEELVLENLK